jgi:hypothetical protein
MYTKLMSGARRLLNASVRSSKQERNSEKRKIAVNDETTSIEGHDLH